MKGVVYLGDGEVAVREFEKPRPGPGQVLIRMKAAGLCGSDLHKYHMSREMAEARNGMIAGHEPTGVVAELGEGVDTVSEGDRVCVYHSLGCGHCPTCVAGEPVFCEHEGAFGRTQDGCHADFMLTDARWCQPLPDDLSFAVGAQLACTACTGFAALRKLPMMAGETLVVFGLGPVGMSALLMGMAMGYRCVGVDVNPYRIDLAKRLGCGDVVSAAEADPVTAVMDLTGGTGAQGVLECSGNAKARTQTAALAARHGTVVLVGAGAPEITFAFTDILRKALTIRGNAVFSMAGYFDTVAFVQNNAVPLDDLVTHRFGIEQGVAAFQTFETGNTGKVIFEWE